MIAGKLDRRITLLAPVVSENTFGEEVSSFEARGTVWAEWLEGQGREFFSAARVNAEIAVVCKIRWRDDVAADWRVLYGGRAFEIVGPPAELGRRDGLRLSLKSIVT